MPSLDWMMKDDYSKLVEIRANTHPVYSNSSYPPVRSFASKGRGGNGEGEGDDQLEGGD